MPSLRCFSLAKFLTLMAWAAMNPVVLFRIAVSNYSWKEWVGGSSRGSTWNKQSEIQGK
jgi:hypothetical protein